MFTAHSNAGRYMYQGHILTWPHPEMFCVHNIFALVHKVHIQKCTKKRLRLQVHNVHKFASFETIATTSAQLQSTLYMSGMNQREMDNSLLHTM